MKEKYIDHYGIDSLPNLKEASAHKVDVFVTLNKKMLEDREELEKVFKVKIRTPEEFVEENEETKNCKKCKEVSKK